MALRDLEPEKIISLIEPVPRNVLTDCSPNTHLTASTILLLPLPFGPTIQVIPLSKLSSILEANDLKPFALIPFKYIIYTQLQFILLVY